MEKLVPHFFAPLSITDIKASYLLVRRSVFNRHSHRFSCEPEETIKQRFDAALLGLLIDLFQHQ